MFVLHLITFQDVIVSITYNIGNYMFKDNIKVYM
jgi:hypothetical protein